MLHSQCSGRSSSSWAGSGAAGGVTATAATASMSRESVGVGWAEGVGG